jgi:hypothetical protein
VQGSLKIFRESGQESNLKLEGVVTTVIRTTAASGFPIARMRLYPSARQNTVASD